MEQDSEAIWLSPFRPFFLGSALFGVFAVSLWLSFLFGVFPYSGILNSVTWHSHEMVFGFSGGVIAGFILTAIGNWSGMRSLHGRKLRVIFWIWVLGRLLLVVPGVPKVLAAFVDLAFFPLLVTYLIPYFRDPEMKFQRIFFLFISLLFLGNLLVYLEVFGILAGSSRAGILLALYVVVNLNVVIGGRVIPFFTESTLSKTQPKTRDWVELFSHLSAWSFLMTQLLSVNPLSRAIGAWIASSFHMIRLSGWYVRRLRRVPLIWVLHLGYFWLCLGFAFTGAGNMGWIPPSLAIHAFTVGGLSIMIFGMMSRVSLGHTGRRLHPSRAVVIGYGMLSVAALVRVIGPWVHSNWQRPAWFFSGVFWIIAFAIFVASYWQILLSPRIDRQVG